MRHPITLGAFVLGALLLTLAALLHLVAVRRTSRHRLLWTAVSLFVPVVGPLAYLLVGRRGGLMDDEDDVFVRDAYVPPPAPLPQVTPVRGRAPLPPLPPLPREADGEA